MRSGEYFYKSKRIDWKPRRVYVGSLADPSVAGMKQLVEKRRIAASLIAAIAPGPAYRIERLARFDVRVADLAGTSGSPASLALAVRAALLEVELDAAAAYLREQARAGFPSGVIEWLERRRDTLERRYLAAVRSVVGLSRVLILNIEAPAPAATPESPSLSIVA